MANTFQRYTASDIGTAGTTVYTVAASTTAVVIGVNIANIYTSQINVDVEIAGVYLVKSVPIPANSAISVLDGKIILKAADTVVITSSVDTSADAIISVLEQV